MNALFRSTAFARVIGNMKAMFREQGVHKSNIFGFDFGFNSTKPQKIIATIFAGNETFDFAGKEITFTYKEYETFPLPF